MSNCARCKTEPRASGSYCLKCDADRMREKRKANPEKYKEVNLRNRVKYLYGLSIEDYKLLLAQGCAICGVLEGLCIDHDHSCCSGAKTCGNCIRGVLCKRHNKVLGYVRDSTEELRSLLNYLQ